MKKKYRISLKSKYYATDITMNLTKREKELLEAIHYLSKDAAKLNGDALDIDYQPYLTVEEL